MKTTALFQNLSQKKMVGLLVIGLAFVVVVGIVYWLGQDKKTGDNETKDNDSSEQVSTVEFRGPGDYTDPNKLFTIKLPANWGLVKPKTTAPEGITTYDFAGTTGFFRISYSDLNPSVGKCEKKISVKLKETTIKNACLRVENGIGFISNAIVKHSGKTFLINTSIRDPYEENKEETLTVLSSLEFLKAQ